MKIELEFQLYIHLIVFKNLMKIKKKKSFKNLKK